jgi:hypothetical protein
VNIPESGASAIKIRVLAKKGSIASTYRLSMSLIT